MKECIVKNGYLWADCPDHKNIRGGHGDFACIHVYQTNDAKWNAPKLCKLVEDLLKTKFKAINFDIEELFLI